MGKAEVMALVSLLSRDRQDNNAVEQYYEHVVVGLARKGILVEATLVAASTDVAVYEWPEGAIDVLGVWYDNKELSYSKLGDLEAYRPVWRSLKGKPSSYTLQDEATRSLRIIPSPEVPSAIFSFDWGQPFGHDYPGYSIVVVHTVVRDDVADYFTLAIALDVLAREFARDSEHRDLTFSKIAEELAVAVYEMVSL